jgi:hypothetical protein
LISVLEVWKGYQWAAAERGRAKNCGLGGFQAGTVDYSHQPERAITLAD